MQSYELEHLRAFLILVGVRVNPAADGSDGQVRSVLLA